jgi:hypothetical protein
VVVNGNDGPLVDVSAESLFSEHPLDRIQVSNLTFSTSIGAITDGIVGQQIMITATFTNYQHISQDYAFIVQITEEGGSVVFIGLQHGTIESGDIGSASLSWTPEQAGNYTVQIFVWDGLGSPPLPLSAAAKSSIEVTG